MDTAAKYHHDVLVKKSLATGAYVLGFALALPAFFFGLGNILDSLVNPLFLSTAAAKSLGYALFVFGWGCIITAVFSLGRIGKGLPASSVPPRTLVDRGIYRFSRHPIYLGASMCFLGASLIVCSFWNVLLGWPLFTWFFFAYAQRVEEPVLETRFGREYRNYRRYVPLIWSFPFRKTLIHSAGRLLDRLSSRINRPLIWRHRQHFLFIGYGLWVGTGVLMGLVALNIFLMAEGISARHIHWLLIVLTLSALSGSRFVSMLAYRVLERCGLRRAWFRVGFVSWGVLAAALLSGLFFLVLTGRSPYLWFDAVFTSLMLSHFFGRLGCLFYGCCYGRETTSALHIRYSDSRLKAVREARVMSQFLYPTQLFSALYGMLIFATILPLWTFMGFQVGVPGALCFILYGTFRFTEEWYRYQKKLILNTFSPAQLICLVLVLIGMVQLVLVLPASDTGFHDPIFSLLTIEDILHRLPFVVLAALGFLTTFLFSYHKHEIGRWGKDN